MKTCTSCKESLALSEFRRASRHKDGLAYACKRCTAKKQRDWRQKASDAVKRADRYSTLRKYGLTLEQYDAMVQRQNGVCAVCKKPETMKTTAAWSLSVDHCHTTQRVRGLLCAHCNRLLGLAREDVEVLREAANYLDSYR